MALYLSQGGEFAFVLATLGLGAGVFDATTSSTLIAIVSLSLPLTPVFVVCDERLRASRLQERTGAGSHEAPHGESNPVIICGAGRMGQVVARFLHAHGRSFTIVDYDSGQIDLLKKFGWKAFFGDVTRLDLLEAAGARTARVLVPAIDQAAAAQTVLELCRHEFPHLQIFARCRNRQDAYPFVHAGVPAYRETFDTALRMGRDVLKSLGVPAFEAEKASYQFRIHDESTVIQMAKHVDDEKQLVQLSYQAREDLSRLIREDQKRFSDPEPDGWG